MSDVKASRSPILRGLVFRAAGERCDLVLRKVLKGFFLQRVSMYELLLSRVGLLPEEMKNRC